MRYSIGTECLCANASHRWSLFSGAIVLLAVLAVAMPASAELMLADFAPLPPSPDHFEFVWNGSFLDEGPGAIGNGDGNLNPDQQIAPGLAVLTPYLIQGLPGSSGNTTSSPQSTDFFDATLFLYSLGGGTNGLPSAGSATVQSLFGGLIQTFAQPLGSGEFQIFTTNPGVPTNATLLLAGTIENAVITGIVGSSTGSVLSAHVTYTGGAIWTEAGSPPTGDFSWSLDGATPHFNVNQGVLAPFSTHATGQFFAVPEPSTLVLLWIAGPALAAGFVFRRRHLP